MPTAKVLSNPKCKGKGKAWSCSPPAMKHCGHAAEEVSGLHTITENPPEETEGGWGTLAHKHSSSGEWPMQSEKAFKKHMLGVMNKKKKTRDPAPDTVHELTLSVKNYLDIRLSMGTMDDSEARTCWYSLEDDFATAEIAILGGPVGQPPQADDNGAGLSHANWEWIGNLGDKADEDGEGDEDNEDDKDDDDDDDDDDDANEDKEGEGTEIEDPTHLHATPTHQSHLHSPSWEFQELPAPVTTCPNINDALMAGTTHSVSKPKGATATQATGSSQQPVGSGSHIVAPFPMSKLPMKLPSNVTKSLSAKAIPQMKTLPRPKPKLVPVQPKLEGEDVIIIPSHDSLPVILWEDEPKKTPKRKLIPDVKTESHQIKWKSTGGENKLPSGSTVDLSKSGTGTSSRSSKGNKLTIKDFKANAEREAEQFQWLNDSLDPKHMKAAAEERQANAVTNLMILSHDSHIEKLKGLLDEEWLKNMELHMHIHKLESDAEVDVKVKVALADLIRGQAAPNTAPNPDSPVNAGLQPIRLPAQPNKQPPPAVWDLPLVNAPPLPPMPNLNHNPEHFPGNPPFNSTHPFAQPPLEDQQAFADLELSTNQAFNPNADFLPGTDGLNGGGSSTH
ncbi:hypothetical protein FRC11_005547, partial [Ceratobasidium sp. 423]